MEVVFFISCLAKSQEEVRTQTQISSDRSVVQVVADRSLREVKVNKEIRGKEEIRFDTKLEPKSVESSRELLRLCNDTASAFHISRLRR